MNILEGFDLAGLVPDGDDLIHLTVEANKLAVGDRLRYFGDPAFVTYPLDRILSKAHAANQRQRIDPIRALPLAKGRALPGDTTYICAVDRDGNGVSFIHSLSMQFGAGMTVPGTGMILNNRVGRGFTLDADHPNCVDSSKRTMSTLNCYIVTRNGRLQVVGGTPGGDGQVQWNSQILVSLLDRHLDPQDAVDRGPLDTHSEHGPRHNRQSRGLDDRKSHPNEDRTWPRAPRSRRSADRFLRRRRGRSGDCCRSGARCYSGRLR